MSGKIDRDKARKILVRSTNWIGDAVMTIPAICALKDLLPKADVSILVKPGVKAVFDNNPDIDKIIIYDATGNHKGLRGKQRLIKELKEEGFDLAILFQNAFEAALLTFFANIPMRIGYATDGRGAFLTDSLRPTGRKGGRHQVYHYLSLIEHIGYKPADMVKPRIFLSDKERERALEFLRQNGVSSEGLLIGISPGAAYGPAKRWSLEGFAGVADNLIERYKAEVVIFGPSEDVELCSEVSAKMRYPSHNIAGMTGLREFMALIDRCSLLLTNDSGPMHIAGALDTPLVVLFGSTDPLSTGPMGEKSVVIKKDVECSPCLKRRCPTDFRCMELITPDKVFEASVSLLERSVPGEVKIG